MPRTRLGCRPHCRFPAISISLAAALAVLLSSEQAAAQQGRGLSEPERRMRDYIRRHTDDQIASLARAVNISSGTMNHAGVRAVGAFFRAALDSLGFQTRWVAMPDAVGRAGHLFAEHEGKDGRKRILLIGHLDTVFEGEGQQFVRQDSIARGAGSSDMKGGNVVMLYALRALHKVGALADANIVVALTGDEEDPGEPLSISRRDLIEAAKRSDAALAFEAGSRDNATIARRGASTWVLTVKGKQAHSSAVFGDSVGPGAIFEAARILDAFRKQLGSEKYLTFSPGIIVGGTDVAYDTTHVSGTARGKLNIVARSSVVPGDLRFLSEQQKERARARMRRIVANNLSQTSAEITFKDGYPAMPPTRGNLRLLAIYDAASRALGYGKVKALDPGQRGAGDVSFVAPYVDGLDGLGSSGRGAHSPEESVNLSSLPVQTERAAVLIYRLSRQERR